MRLWQDDATAIPVRWFRADPGAKIVSFPHNFLSSVWDQFREDPPLGDLGTVKHTYDKGINAVGYDGTNRCGGDDPWINGGNHNSTPAIQTYWNGASKCCNGIPDPGPPPVQSCPACIACGPTQYNVNLTGLASPYDIFNGFYTLDYDGSPGCQWSVNVGSGPTFRRMVLIIGQSPFHINSSMLTVSDGAFPETIMIWRQDWFAPINCCVALPFIGQAQDPTGGVPANVVVSPVPGPCNCP